MDDPLRTKPVFNHRGKPILVCSRCGSGGTLERWRSITGEVQLCEGCLNGFRTFIANGKNKPKPKQPDRPATAGPASQTTAADQVLEPERETAESKPQGNGA